MFNRLKDKYQEISPIREKLNSILTIRLKLFLFVLFIYGLSIHFTLQGPNPTSRFLLTKSIAERGTFWFPEEYKEQYWLSPDYAQIDNKLFSDKAPGLSFLAVPIFIISKIIGNLLPFNLEPYSSNYPSNDIFAIIGIQVGLVFLAAFGILRLYDINNLMGVPERNSIIACLIIAFGTPYFVYARTLFNHVPAGVFLMNSLFHIIKFRQNRNYTHLILAGFFSGYGFVIEFPLIFAIPWFTVLLLLPVKQVSNPWKNRIKTIVLYGITTGIFTLPLFYYNLFNFGNITANALAFSHWADNLHFLEPVNEGLSVLLLSNDRGLLYFSPIVLFGLAGLYSAFRRYPLEISIIFSIILYFIVFYAKKWESHGGAAFGPRYIVPILLLFGIGLGWIIEDINDSLLKQGTMLIVSFWSFFVSSLGALFAVLIFTPYGTGDPIFEEAFTNLLTGNTNAPILKFYPSIFILSCIFVTFIFIVYVLNIASTKTSYKERAIEHELIEAYTVFVWSSLIFLVTYFFQISIILSATYIKTWESASGESFFLKLPKSEWCLILLFAILAIHSILLILNQYSSQIIVLLKDIWMEIKKKKPTKK